MPSLTSRHPSEAPYKSSYELAPGSHSSLRRRVVNVTSFFFCLSSPRNDSSLTLYMNLAFIQASQIRDLLEKFIMESFKSDVEFVRAVQDHLVKQQGNLLPFKKGEIIRVVRNSNIHLSKGESICCVMFLVHSVTTSVSLSYSYEFMSR